MLNELATEALVPLDVPVENEVELEVEAVPRVVDPVEIPPVVDALPLAPEEAPALDVVAWVDVPELVWADVLEPVAVVECDELAPLDEVAESEDTVELEDEPVGTHSLVLVSQTNPAVQSALDWHDGRTLQATPPNATNATTRPSFPIHSSPTSSFGAGDSTYCAVSLRPPGAS